ncbi:MAG: flagellar assembly protein FliW [Planctomycetota bacterium]
MQDAQSNQTPSTAAPTDNAAHDAADSISIGSGAMLAIETSRFGTIEVERDRILNFKGGLLGFPDARQFALIQTGEENYFFWMQCVTDPKLAFVVCDPSLFIADYTVDEVPLRDEAREELGFSDDLAGAELAEATQVLAICNRVGEHLTGNLLGPIVVNVATCVAKQIVLTEKRWTTRQPLLKLATEPLRKSA